MFFRSDRVDIEDAFFHNLGISGLRLSDFAKISSGYDQDFREPFLEVHPGQTRVREMVINGPRA